MTNILIVVGLISLPITFLIVRGESRNQQIQIFSTVVMAWATVFMALTSYQEMVELKIERRIEYSQHRNELLQATASAVELVTSPKGAGQRTCEEQKQILDEVRSLFSAQLLTNPILSENIECQALWKDALLSAKIVPGICSLPMDKRTGEDGISSHLNKVFQKTIKITQKLERMVVGETSPLRSAARP